MAFVITLEFWREILRQQAFGSIFRQALPSYALAIAMTIAGTLALALNPALIGRIVDGVTSREWDGVIPLLILLGVLQLVAGYLRSKSAQISAIRAEWISHELRSTLAKTVFHDREDHASIRFQSRGQMLSLFNRDIEALWDLLGFAITEMVASLVMLLALGIIVIVLSPPVGLLFISIATLFCFAYFDNGHRIRALFALAAPKFDRMIGLINALLDGYETVASFRRQVWATSSMDRLSREVNDLAARAHRRIALFSFVTGTINTLGVLAVWAIALPGMMSGAPGAMTLGELVAILFYFSMLTDPLEKISGAAKAMSKGAISLRRIAKFQAEMAASEDYRPIPAQVFTATVTSVSQKSAPILRVRNAWDGSHKDHQPLLAPISLDLEEGEILGFAGASGSGKSTLLRLLARLIPEAGSGLRLDGVPYAAISEDDFRQKVLYFTQFPAIFPVPLGENLFFDGTETDTNSVLARVDLTRRGEALFETEDVLGAGLSGGEMQRLALARLLSKTPRLLLFDEPTSALDYTNSQGVCDAIIGHMRNVCGAVIVASHDPNVLARCNRISVMQDGQVVETGEFDALRSTSAAFCQVIESVGTRRA